MISHGSNIVGLQGAGPNVQYDGSKLNPRLVATGLLYVIIVNIHLVTMDTGTVYRLVIN